MKSTSSWLATAFGAVLVSTVLPAQAEIFGMPNGRLANPESLPQLSVEGSFNTLNDYQHIGGRVNYKTSPDLVIYGDFGISEFGSAGADADGTSFGGGAYYYLANLSSQQPVDLAVKGSLHLATLSADGFGSDIDINYNLLSFELLASGREPISDNGLMWYGNIGFHRISFEFDIPGPFGGTFDDSDSEIGFGGGVILPTDKGEFYGGIDIIDEMILGIGFRYFL